MSSPQFELAAVESTRTKAESQLAEAMSYIHELTISIESITADHRRLEADITSLRFELEESQHGRHEGEERANRLQWELHSEVH